MINDLYVPLIARGETGKKTVLVSRIVLIVIALFSMLISIFNSNIINVLYVSGLFYGVSVFMPMLLGMYTKSVTARGAAVSIIVTVLFALAWQYKLAAMVPVLGAVPANIAGLFVSLVVMLLVSKLDRGGQERL